MADINQWQLPRNEANKVLGWRSNGQGMENKAIGEDIQEHSDNLDELATVSPGEAGKSVLALPLASGIREFLGEFDTRAQAEAATIATDIDTVTLNGDYSAVDRAILALRRSVSEPVHAGKLQSADGAWWVDPFYTDHVVSIPSDFDTLQEAVDFFSRTPVRNKAKIILNIETGHALTAGLHVANRSFDHFEIRSTDLLVNLDPGFVGAGPSNSLMYADGAVAPRWNTRVDMNGLGGHGIDLRSGSFGYVYPTKGVTGATGLGDDLTAGLFAENSRVNAYQSWFPENGRNAWITVASNAYLQSSTLNGAAAIGAYVSRGSVASLTDADVFNAGNVGLWVNEAVVAARSGLNASNCNIGVYAVLGARVSCVDAVATGCSEEGFFADGGWIEASGSDASAAGTYGYRVSDGGQIIKTGGTGTANIPSNGVTGAGLIIDSSVTATFPLLVGLDGTATISDDWDAITMTGLYRNSSSAAVGIPVASTNWSVLHITLTGTQAAQLAMRSGANGVSYRRKASGAWQPWVTIV
ncbi:pyocin knob domain-containing protein [Sinorhizobium meliloti]|uniref:pyocin knob domain-containing protein n=1 Tax=Rhizobium meliloti TaxID=382 RepID=UPI00237FCD61|nr:pyocin knob domain-containing protein [Sinorhizobium meliloti]